MPHNVMSLISVGRHPQSGRPRRAEQDARAVELGIKLAGEQLEVVHAGSSDEPVLRQYAGMGLPSVTVLEQDGVVDASDSILNYLKQSKVDIVLAGVRAESGESSGMVPYLLAEKMGWPMVARVADITEIKDGQAVVLLALPRGQRRQVTVKLPFIATIDNAAQAPRQTAYGPGLRAKLDGKAGSSLVDDVRISWEENPAKARPKRLKVVKAKTAADRFKAATAKPQGGAGKVMKNESVEEKAQAIFDLLIEEKVLR
jgi:electron transfer flavoprotein beta subunit